MKSIITILAFTLTSIISFGQDIMDVSLSSSNLLTVLDVKNNRISLKYIGVNDKLSGFSANIIVVTSASNLVTVYDQNFNSISSKYISEGDYVKNVNGNYIIIKNSSGLVTTYDKEFNSVTSRYE